MRKTWIVSRVFLTKFIVVIACISSLSFDVRAQTFLKVGLNLGDTVPPLRVKEWIKGKGIDDFSKDKIYIVEFWATWCRPCLNSMPHLSELARKYKGVADFLAIDIYEKESTPLSKIRSVVENMGSRMDFPVGIQDGEFMAKNWVDTSEARAIPTTFLIRDRKIEWIGHPIDLDSVLTRVLESRWDVNFARMRRNNELYLQHLESMALEVLIPKIERYVINKAGNTHNRVKVSPDSILIEIDHMVRNVPILKFLPVFASITFEALLKTDFDKAYDFANQLIIYGDEPPYWVIIKNVEENMGQLQIPADIYRVTAACYQQQIHDRYTESEFIPKSYKQMAKMYRLAGDEQKAVNAERNADGILPNKNL